MIIFHSHLLKGGEIAKTVDKSPVLLITRLLFLYRPTNIAN